MHERDVEAVYRLLCDAGVSQRALAALTGQSQSEISEILGGRQVAAVHLLERIAAGLGTPLSWWRLAGGDERGDVARLTVLVDAAQIDVSRLTAAMRLARARSMRRSAMASKVRETMNVLHAQVTALAAMMEADE
jgi:transcriptional regulator with XRE-family HTH domain